MPAIVSLILLIGIPYGVMLLRKILKEQEESFNTAEYQKEEFKNSFFVEKEDKDNPTVLYSSINVSVK